MPPCYLFHIFFVLSWQKLRCEKCTKTLCFPILFEHRPFQLQDQIILNFRCKRLRNKPSFQGSCGHGFLVDFSMILGSCWGPKSMQNEVRNKLGTWLGEKMDLSGFMMAQDAFWGSKTLQEADLVSKTAPIWIGRSPCHLAPSSSFPAFIREQSWMSFVTSLQQNLAEIRQKRTESC